MHHLIFWQIFQVGMIIPILLMRKQRLIDKEPIQDHQLGSRRAELDLGLKGAQAVCPLHSDGILTPTVIWHGSEGQPCPRG